MARALTTRDAKQLLKELNNKLPLLGWKKSSTVASKRTRAVIKDAARHLEARLVNIAHAAEDSTKDEFALEVVSAFNNYLLRNL